MTEYRTEIFDLVNNPDCTFYKLYVDGKCAFDDFLEEVMRNVADCKSMKAIIAYMDSINARLLPATIYNYIQSGERNDLHEFKKRNLRVYVIDQKPNIYIVMSGYKDNQKKDIKNLVAKTKDFPKK